MKALVDTGAKSSAITYTVACNLKLRVREVTSVRVGSGEKLTRSVCRVNISVKSPDGESRSIVELDVTVRKPVLKESYTHDDNPAPKMFNPDPDVGQNYSWPNMVARTPALSTQYCQALQRGQRYSFDRSNVEPPSPQMKDMPFVDEDGIHLEEQYEGSDDDGNNPTYSPPPMELLPGRRRSSSEEGGPRDLVSDEKTQPASDDAITPVSMAPLRVSTNQTPESIPSAENPIHLSPTSLLPHQASKRPSYADIVGRSPSPPSSAPTEERKKKKKQRRGVTRSNSPTSNGVPSSVDAAKRQFSVGRSKTVSDFRKRRNSSLQLHLRDPPDNRKPERRRRLSVPSLASSQTPDDSVDDSIPPYQGRIPPNISSNFLKPMSKSNGNGRSRPKYLKRHCILGCDWLSIVQPQFCYADYTMELSKPKKESSKGKNGIGKNGLLLSKGKNDKT